MDFNDPHAPTPEFRASLKRQLQRSYRAEQQFAPARVVRWGRVGMMVGLAAGAVLCLTVGLVLGAVGGYASAAGLNARDREVPNNTTSARRQFTKSRLEIARANYDSVQRDVAAGKASTAALTRAKEEVDSMEARVAQLDVDLAGVAITQPPPAPLSLLKSPMRTALTALSCGVAATSVTSAQSAPVQQGIPVVAVSTVSAKTSTTLGAVLGVRELSDGRVLVNDAGRRQIKIFNRSLGNATVAQDSALGKTNSYGERPGQIFSYLGDSTILTEIVSQDVNVLDKNGAFVRSIATPQFEDGVTPFPMRFPMPRATDSHGRLIARGGFAVRRGVVADSTLIYRADLETRRVDIIGVTHYAKGINREDPPENGNRVVTSIHQPVETVDSWAVLSDGTVAFVRGQDYHVDWLLPDGTKAATSKLPFDWKRLTDDDKQKLADSAKVVWDSLMAIRNKRMAVMTSPRRGDDPSGGASGATGRSSGGVAPPGQQGSIQRIISVPISEIPDYYPPIRENSAMADLDGNLWILPTTSAQSQHGELVYDVVNPKQGLFKRVRIPLGRSIAGFGKGGVVFLQTGDRTNGFYLERVNVPK